MQLLLCLFVNLTELRTLVLHLVTTILKGITCDMSNFMQVMMRRLPPSLTPESLIDQISPLPEHDFFYFVKADMR